MNKRKTIRVDRNHVGERNALCGAQLERKTRKKRLPRGKWVASSLLVLCTGGLVFASCDQLDEQNQQNNEKNKQQVDNQKNQDECQFKKSLTVKQGELVREKGNPWQEVTVTIQEAGEYTLTLENGGMAGFGVYTLDKKVVISPDLFNAKDTVYSWKVELEAGEYQFLVKLAGKPGTKVKYSLASELVSADGSTITDEFTITNGDAEVVSICGGLTLLSFSEAALQDVDKSMTFVAKCTARECIEGQPASDRIEINTVDNAGYVFNDAPILQHPRVPFTVRKLDGDPIYAYEGEKITINGEMLVQARSFIPHFSEIYDDAEECGLGKTVPVFPLPFYGIERFSQGNNGNVSHYYESTLYAIDINSSLGDEAVAVADGDLYWRPSFADPPNDPEDPDDEKPFEPYGYNQLFLKINPDDETDTRYYRYGHCKAVHPDIIAKGLTAGDLDAPVSVKNGEPICYVGMEGTATGPHIHGDLVKISSWADRDKGESIEHGYQGLHLGTENHPLEDAEFKMFCPAIKKWDPDICEKGDLFALFDGCTSYGYPDTADEYWHYVQREKKENEDKEELAVEISGISKENDNPPMCIEADVFPDAITDDGIENNGSDPGANAANALYANDPKILTGYCAKCPTTKDSKTNESLCPQALLDYSAPGEYVFCGGCEASRVEHLAFAMKALLDNNVLANQVYGCAKEGTCDRWERCRECDNWNTCSDQDPMEMNLGEDDWKADLIGWAIEKKFFTGDGDAEGDSPPIEAYRRCRPDDRVLWIEAIKMFARLSAADNDLLDKNLPNPGISTAVGEEFQVLEQEECDFSKIQDGDQWWVPAAIALHNNDIYCMKEQNGLFTANICEGQDITECSPTRYMMATIAARLRGENIPSAGCDQKIEITCL